MTTQKLELSNDTVLVRLSGGVTGITRRTTKPEETRDGKAVTTTREVTTRQADEAEATHAKKLLGALRSLVDKSTTTCVGMVITNSTKLRTMREEIAPIRAQIEAHNAGARYHYIDYSLICAPIALQVDPAALAEVCRQISDELKIARAFFSPLKADSIDTLDSWNPAVKNWVQRTRGLDTLFPTLTGEMIGQALQCVKDLREKVGDLTRAKVKLSKGPEAALREALADLAADPANVGLIDNAIGFVAITDNDAKAQNEAVREAQAENEAAAEVP